MAPIYNPPASSAAIDSDTQYFTDLGLLDGMSEIISAKGATTFPTPTGSYSSGTASVITNNLLKWDAASASSWEGWSLGGTYDKVLMLAYTICSTAQNQYPCLISKNALDESDEYVSDDFYMSANVPNTPVFATQMYKRTASTWTLLASDTTIYAGDSYVYHIDETTPAFGTALYVEDGIQKTFMKFGSTSEWFPIFSTTDGDSTSFQSVAMWTLAKNQRVPTPFLVWGA